MADRRRRGTSSSKLRKPKPGKGNVPSSSQLPEKYRNLPKLTAKMRRQHKAANICFDCREPGHAAQDSMCPLAAGHRSASATESNGDPSLQAIQTDSETREAQSPPQSQPASNSTTPRVPFPFEAIPPEIRLKIYEPLISEAVDYAKERSQHHSPGRNTNPPILAIMCTSKLIYHEFKEALWSQLPMSLIAGRTYKKPSYIRKMGMLKPTDDAVLATVFQSLNIKHLSIGIPVIPFPFIPFPFTEKLLRGGYEMKVLDQYKTTIDPVANMLRKASRIHTLYLHPCNDDPNYVLNGFVRVLTQFPKVDNVDKFEVSPAFINRDIWQRVRDYKARIGDNSEMLV
jgi:hypothetical protein